MILSLAFALPVADRAQDAVTPDESANPVSSDGQINQPSLKELMATNNVVTNTVGIVLAKISRTLWDGGDSLVRLRGHHPAG